MGDLIVEARARQPVVVVDNERLDSVMIWLVVQVELLKKAV